MPLFAAPSSAAPLLVTNTDDSGAGSLRQAMIDANATAEADEITFGVTGTIALSSTLPTVTRDLTITGPGPAQLAVTGNSMAMPIFSASPAAGDLVRIEKLKIADARATSFAGGGISMSGPGGLALDTVWLFDNFGGQGGAVFADRGSISIQNSTLNNNHAQFGGAIVARRFGMNPAANVQLTNSTLTDNGAMEFGGALNPAEGATLTINSSTITNNTANSDMNTSGDGGGIYNNLSTVNIANTILAGNSVGANSPGTNGQCGGSAYVSVGYNLRSAADPNCMGFNATGDLVDSNPLVGMLGMNGGATLTIPLLTGSPAINAGNPETPGGPGQACPTTDQRGQPRGGGTGVCDIGAFEVQPAPPTPPAGGSGATNPFDLKAAIKKCKKKFAKGPGRRKCIKRAKKRALG